MGFVVVHLQMKASRRVQQLQREVQKENREWIQKQDDICHKMWEDYNAME